jgi:hypothetical protein
MTASNTAVVTAAAHGGPLWPDCGHLSDPASPTPTSEQHHAFLIMVPLVEANASSSTSSPMPVFAAASASRKSGYMLKDTTILAKGSNRRWN